jgi:hypothetical protein
MPGAVDGFFLRSSANLKAAAVGFELIFFDDALQFVGQGIVLWVQAA